jgi:hypothetical protein
MTTDDTNRVRASDTEREDYAKMIRAAMTEGRLTLEEGEERLSKVYEARFRDELPPLTGDLPDGGRRALYDNPEAREEVRRHANKAFAGHTGFVVVIAAALVGLWAVSHAHFFWPAIPLLFLVFSLLKHAAWRRWTVAGGNAWQRGRGPWGRGAPWDRGRFEQGWRR